MANPNMTDTPHSDAVYINIHCPSQKEAKKLSKALLEKKLCGTVKITSDVHLMYIMDEKLEGEDTALMTIKTTTRHVQDIQAFILENHSWGTPCVEIFPLTKDVC
jgi:uncharacterized protein involved in tolerance to divalent cations